MKKFICHVCGYSELTNPPWWEDGITPSYDICNCCGVEFGIDDINEKSYEYYKLEWLSRGYKWFREEDKPKKWDLSKQMDDSKLINVKYLPFYLRNKI